MKEKMKAIEIIDKEDPIVDYNFHSHTKRCGHAIGEDREYVEKAILKGYKILGISDHRPYYNLSFPDQRMEWSEFSDYINSINALKKEYDGNIEIYIGLECEFFEEHLEQLKKLKQSVDYLILGQHHYIEDGITKEYLTKEKMVEMLEDIKNAGKSGLFLYIAHPDYFWRVRKMWDKFSIFISHEICKISLEYDLPLELNYKHLMLTKEKMPEMYLGCLSFWQIAKEYNCKVCLGVDAHDPKDFFKPSDDIFFLIDILKLNLVSKDELLKRIKNKN